MALVNYEVDKGKVSKFLEVASKIVKDYLLGPETNFSSVLGWMFYEEGVILSDFESGVYDNIIGYRYVDGGKQSFSFVLSLPEGVYEVIYSIEDGGIYLTNFLEVAFGSVEMSPLYVSHIRGFCSEYLSLWENYPVNVSECVINTFVSVKGLAFADTSYVPPIKGSNSIASSEENKTLVYNYNEATVFFQSEIKRIFPHVWQDWVNGYSYPWENWYYITKVDVSRTTKAGSLTATFTSKYVDSIYELACSSALPVLFGDILTIANNGGVYYPGVNMPYYIRNLKKGTSSTGSQEEVEVYYINQCPVLEVRPESALATVLTPPKHEIVEGTILSKEVQRLSVNKEFYSNAFSGVPVVSSDSKSTTYRLSDLEGASINVYLLPAISLLVGGKD